MPESNSTDAPTNDAENTGTEGQQTQETPPEGDQQTQEQSKPDNKTTFDADYVKTLRSESANYRTKLRDAEAALEAANGRVSEFESTAPELTRRAESAEALATRYEVALEKGLPLDLAKRLIGDDRDALSADADALLASVGSNRPAPDLGQGTRQSVQSKKPSMSEALRAFALGND